MKFTRLLSALMAMLLITFLALGCADNASDTPKDTTSSDTAAAEETGEVELQPDLPDVKYDGEDIIFLVRGVSFVEWQSQDIFAEEQDGEPINDAVYTRNVYLEETYNIKIQEFQATDPGNQAKKSISAGSDDYQVVMANTSESATLASQNLLYNLNDMPYMDLTKPWWDQRSVEQMSIGGKLFFCTGDLSIMANDATWILMFNKKLIDDYSLENPYDLVYDNKWTVDKMVEMGRAVSSDIDGDGSFKWDIDQFGFVTHESSCEGFFFGSGCNIVTKDEDDMPILNMANDRVITVIERATPLISDKTLVVNGSVQALSPTLQMQPVFESGRSLFYGEVMQCIIRLRAMEIDFGVLPFPKLDQDQDEYNHFIHVTACMLSVPLTNTDLEKTGILLEAMSAKSTYTLQEAYYDICLEGKFMRDEESAGMLDIILKTRNYDIGYIYNWGNLFTSFRTSITKGDTDFASKYAKAEKSAVKAMEKTISSWLEG
ncbi:MAG: extracellular solute-binding protein [Eubacteriales bacterium]|nr:extracellular solute-binding protein [Eubacteriales bacterium]